MYQTKQRQYCPLCYSKDISILYEGMTDLSYLIDGKFNLLNCNNCELKFQEQILNEKQLSKYYPKNEYYSSYHYSFISNIYHKISSSKNLRNLLFFLKPILHNYYIKKGTKLLEIGCGSGLQLKHYKDNGVETYGIEPYGGELSYRDIELGIERISYKDIDYEDNMFDIILIKDTIEHVNDNKELLLKCNKWLKRNGFLIINTQNTRSLWAKIFGRYWFGYDMPRHIHNYNMKNIELLAKHTCFEIRNKRSYDSTYMFLGSIKFFSTSKTMDNYQYWVYNPLTKILLLPISLIVTLLGLGSLMEITLVPR